MKQLGHDDIKFTKRKHAITLVLNGVKSPANIGGIFRLAEAFGVEEIITDATDFNTASARFKRTARHTDQLVNYTSVESLEDYLQKLKDRSYSIIALEITDGSIAIEKLNLQTDTPIALIIGAENHGVFKDILAKVDSAVHINMFGENTSLNVTQATAIALFEITKTLTAKS